MLQIFIPSVQRCVDLSLEARKQQLTTENTFAKSIGECRPDGIEYREH